MNLFKRFIYYFIGLSLGSLIVYFIWTGKDVSFDYGMDARTLKTIRTKTLHYSESAKLSMKRMKLDSTTIHSILSIGDVDFGKGKPRQTPCAEYYVTGNNELENISLLIKRCDSSATIEKITVE